VLIVLLGTFGSAIAACGGQEAEEPEPDVAEEAAEETVAEPTAEETVAEPAADVEEEVAEPETEMMEVSLAIGNHLTNEAWHAAFDELLASFTEEHPNITIEQQSTAFGELLARVAADRMADEPPDMYILPAWWLGNLAESGLPAIPPDDIAADVKENYTPGAVEAVTWEGQVYGVPFENNPTLMIYNVSMLEAAGYDQPPETLEELMEYAKELTIKDEDGNVVQYGWSEWVGSLNFNYLPFASMLYSCGGEVFDSETGQASFNSEAGVRVLEAQVEMINEGAFNPEITAADWYTGRVAITILPNWTRFYLATYSDPANYKAAPVPHCAGSESSAIVYTWFIIVNQASEHQQEAFEFVRWMTQPYADDQPTREAEFYYNIASIMPARYHDLEVMRDRFSTDIFPAFLESVEYAKSPPPVPSYEEIINIVIAEIENAWFMRKTPQEALDDAAAQANALLQAP
jgi:ABC-type glycerol-3-phosphate transport system substrate-binding protein